MGLFDGYDRDKGSAAEIARVLDIPVVLVVDAKSAAYSIAPLLQGFVNFRKDVHIAGVIFNKVGSERHYKMLQEVCDDLQIRCFGYLPKRPELEQGSRYLGLDYSQQPETKSLVALLEQHIDWRSIGSLLVRTARTTSLNGPDSKSERSGLRALIAHNTDSFTFFYQETLDSFSSRRFFDPEKDIPSFEGVDLLYLPGGYPEKHLEALMQNEACRNAIREYAEKGGSVVAECGGMMYLCQNIITDEGTYPMCGVLPYTITARKEDRKLSLGYRRFVLDGKEYRGHEFHYTQLASQGSPLTSATQVYNAKGEPVDTPVFRYKNVLASYTHLYQL